MTVGTEKEKETRGEGVKGGTRRTRTGTRVRRGRGGE